LICDVTCAASAVPVIEKNGMATALNACVSKAVLFLTFDENDGFFDQRAPSSPPAFNPDDSRTGAPTVDIGDDVHRAKLASVQLAAGVT
jgi:phospholipase C